MNLSGIVSNTLSSLMPQLTKDPTLSEFNFPIHEGQPIGESQSLGSLTGKAKNKAPEVNAIRCLETVNLLKHHGWTVSHEWKETIKELLAKSPPANRFGTRFQTVMMQIPNEPGLRVEEAP